MRFRRLTLSLFAVAALLGAFIPAAQADEQVTAVSAYTAGTKAVGQLTNAWGWVTPAEAGSNAWTEVLLSSGWSRSQIRQTDEAGYFVIPLTYGATTPGEYLWRVGTDAGGSTAYSESFTLQRTGGVTAHSAGTKVIGAATNTWGRVDGATSGTRVWSEVRLTNGWSRSQTRTTQANGSFVIPLTYGATTVGTHTWRVGASIGGANVYSDTFTLQRTGGITAHSAGTKVVGDATNTWGRVDGATAGTTVWTEVQLSSRWSRSQTRTTQSNGSFVIPLTYGAATVGTYTWRVGSSLGGITVYSAPFTLERTARASSGGGVYAPAVCDMVKGNINAQGEKIYHVPGGQYYSRTHIDYSAGERCFRTEAEARAAGWRKSQR